MVNNYTSLQCQ